MPTFLQVATLAIAVVGCNAEDDKVFKGAGNSQRKPEATLLASLQGGEGDSETEKDVATVNYVVTVHTASSPPPDGDPFCKGDAKLVITAKGLLPGLKVPEAMIKCNNLLIDLGAVLGGGKSLFDTGGSGGGEGGEKPFTHDGKVLAFAKFSGATFDPPAPFLMGPLVQDASKYEGFNRTTDHKVTGADPDSGETFSANGKFQMEVLGVDKVYEVYGNKFEKVLHWQRVVSGFEGANPRVGLMVEKMEWLWNTRPIMLPKITIYGSLKNFIEDDGGAIDALTGKLTISLTVKSYDIVE